MTVTLFIENPTSHFFPTIIFISIKLHFGQMMESLKVKSRVKGHSVILSFGSLLKSGTYYAITEPAPFVFDVRPIDDMTTSRTFVERFVRRAIRDGNSTVLSLKRVLSNRDECEIYDFGQFLRVIRKSGVEREKYVRHLASLKSVPTNTDDGIVWITVCSCCRSADIRMKSDGVSYTCRKCGHVHTQKKLLLDCLELSSFGVPSEAMG